MGAWNHGEFCWQDLATTNITETKNFYQKVFGWTFEDITMKDGSSYSLCKINGEECGGVYEQPAEMGGTPSYWGNYIYTTDLTQTLRTCETKSARTILPATNVEGFGEMAVVMTPTQEVVHFWTSTNPKDKHPSYTDKTPGAPAWRELLTHDVETAGKFYCELTQWTIKTQEMSDYKYHCFHRSGVETPDAGMMMIQKDWGDMPSNWMLYFATDDVNKTTGLVLEAGGTVRAPATEVPEIGTFAVYTDNNSAAFGVFKFIC